jgi:DNA mismatch endonuclease (patch repair protein)
MADVVDKATRSRMMSGIRAQNTSPELQVRSLLHRAGFRFRLHQKNLPGKPDIVLSKLHIAIFVHGCFWHSHQNCHLASIPKTNTKFWHEKLSKNVERDTRATRALRRKGWHVFTIWECDIDEPGTRKLLSKIRKTIE